MQTILVANPKGGCGKTTLATNVAGFLAGKRQRVVLADEDPQRSASLWLDRRPALFPRIMPALRETEAEAAVSIDAQWLVVDSPAGLHGDALEDEVQRADVLLVPVSMTFACSSSGKRFFSMSGRCLASKTTKKRPFS